jgi:hypothetical protein
MPTPLRLNGPSKGSDAGYNPSGYFTFNPSQLTDFVNLTSPMMKEAAGDAEAGALFNLWKISTITKEADRIKDRVYDIPKDFDQNELMRLKTSGLLIKRDSGIGFTDKAEQIIQTMVLGEENSFQKSAVDKPYSLILAEIKAPKRTNGLTHTASTVAPTVKPEKKDVFRTSGLVSLAMSNNIAIPGNAYPTDSSPFIYNKRVVATGGGSSKEYNVRVFENEDGTFDVWGWNGRINGTMTPQPKGRYHSKNNAIAAATGVIQSKENGSSSYSDAYEAGYPRLNDSLPGLRVEEGGSAYPTGKKPTSKPVTKTSPKTSPVSDAELKEKSRKAQESKEEAERKRVEEEKRKKEEEMAEQMAEMMINKED